MASTLSLSGHVSRGVCEVAANHELVGVREATEITSAADGIINLADGCRFTGDEWVSMNCWGFTPAVFTGLEELFVEFLNAHGSTEKSEFYIPSAVAALIASGQANVRVLPVESPWFGVTYRDDRPHVITALQKLVAEKTYPSPLW